jgi:hypothetical protein
MRKLNRRDFIGAVGGGGERLSTNQSSALEQPRIAYERGRENSRRAFEKMRRQGQGMIGMKVVGQGSLVQGEKSLTPEECFKFETRVGRC